MYQLLFLVICLIGSSLADDDVPDIKKALKTCAPKYPSVVKLDFDDFCEPSVQTSDKDTKCLIKCIGDATGYMTKFKGSEAPSVEAALTKCFALVKPDACDTAYDQWKCICEAERPTGKDKI